MVYTSRTWTALPDMPSSKKELGCGIVDIGDGEREIVATGVSSLFDFNSGRDFSVYIYNMKTKTWRRAGKHRSTC